MEPWRRLDSTTLVHDRWMNLRADRCELPGGAIVEPYYVIEESDWVHVFAMDEAGRVLVVRQYRHGAATFCTELPGGVIDAGESPLDTARRELLEETGYAADAWEPVGALYANPARQTNRVHLFLARGLRREAAQALDPTEEIAVSLLTVDEIRRSIAGGEFSQAMHVASFHLALERTKESR